MAMVNKKSLLQPVSLALSIILIVCLALLSGCTTGTSGNKQDDKQIMEDFNALLGNNPSINTVIEFIDANISNVSKENGSQMVVALEGIQKQYLPELETKYYSVTIQSEINEIYKPGFETDVLDYIRNEGLRELLIETNELGYRVETAEGMYFPIISYEYLKKYSSNITEDIKDYIDILAVESNNVPAKDAALMIGWQEIVERALAQEEFIKNHESSVKLDDMKQLYNKYLLFTLYGLNNTPLFSYDAKVMVPAAKTAYLSVLESKGGNTESPLLQILSEYMDLLANTNYKLSEEVNEFRNGYRPQL